MLFIVPQTNRIADEHLGGAASRWISAKTPALGSQPEPRRASPLLFVSNRDIAANLWTGDYILDYVHHNVTVTQG